MASAFTRGASSRGSRASTCTAARRVVTGRSANGPRRGGAVASAPRGVAAKNGTSASCNGGIVSVVRPTASSVCSMAWLRAGRWSRASQSSFGSDLSTRAASAAGSSTAIASSVSAELLSPLSLRAAPPPPATRASVRSARRGSLHGAFMALPSHNSTSACCSWDFTPGATQLHPSRARHARNSWVEC